MSILKTNDSKQIIPIHIFNTCLIDGKQKKEIIELFPSRQNGAYYLNKFINFIKTYHNIDIKEYVEKFLNINWPICPISNEHVGYKIAGSGLIFSKFKRGKISKELCPAFKKACEKLSKDRLGDKNPMYGKKAWNSGLTKYTDEIMASTAKKRIGIKYSDATISKMMEARKKHPLKARHITKHSKESKEKMRQATINRWMNGDFSFKKTTIEKKVETWLSENGFQFQYQVSINGFIADFACLDKKIIIECQGDFFHCNPKIEKYANPIYAIQKRNIYRDSIKRKVYAENEWKLIELWESDINSGEFKTILKCELKK
jgi:very-short-patch-repair endonuclease